MWSKVWNDSIKELQKNESTYIIVCEITCETWDDMLLGHEILYIDKRNYLDNITHVRMHRQTDIQCTHYVYSMQEQFIGYVCSYRHYRFKETTIEFNKRSQFY